jgi:hypothetical protein
MMEHVTKEQYEARKKTDIPDTYQYGLSFVQLASCNTMHQPAVVKKVFLQM